MGGGAFLGKTIIKGLSGYLLKINPSGSIDVAIQDQHTPALNLFFTQQTGLSTNVAVEVVMDKYDVTLDDASGCSVGDYFGMFNADEPLNNRAYFAEILGVAANVVSLDTPFDFDFKVGDTAACFTRDMGVDGSVTPQVFSITVGEHATQSIDINRLMISMVTTGTVDLSKFGDITRLTRGIVLRRTNGFSTNIWNVKTNGELANLCFDYGPSSKTKPNEGQDGVRFRDTYNGQDKRGVVIRLAPGDRLDLIVQDDLSLLGVAGTNFRIIGEGSYVLD